MPLFLPPSARPRSSTIALVVAALLLLIPVSPVDAANVETARTTSLPTTEYAADFFAEYRPQTALDMVRLVPGFRIDNGNASRGLGGAQGNVLIDGRRPDAKQDSISSQLQRIPADRVERLVLLQPGTTIPGVEVDGRRTLLNVRLTEGSERAWTWSTTIEQDTDNGPPTPSGRISMIDRWGRTRVRAGVSAGVSYVGNRAREVILDLDQAESSAIEDRQETERFRNRWVRFNLNTVTSLGDRRTLRTNAELQQSDADNRLRSLRLPVGLGDSDPVLRVLAGDTQQTRYELGATLGSAIGEDWRARLIGLTRRNDSDDFDGLDRTFLDGTVDAQEHAPLEPLRRSDTDTVTTESILRTEWVWTGLEDHRLQFDLESAWNALDNALLLRTLDETQGELIPVDLPGSDRRVEEWRVDGRVSDRFELAGLIFEPAIGGEFSRIRQVGETGREQEFSFIKPALSIVHAPSADRRSRMRVERAVAQLDFNDFISAADFDDDELDFGNPTLGPQQTWIAELEHERRFGEIGVATLTAYHHWIQDRQERLPIGDGLDVAGNIGDGRRWGLSLETTLPLDGLGLQSSRLDLRAGWEDSSITDPITGEDRPLAWQRRYSLRTEFRQDLAIQGWAWGIETGYADLARDFGADEVNRQQNGIDVEAFIETTRFEGVKLRLLAQNLIDRPFDHDRLLFDGDRSADSTPTRQESRRLRRDRSILLSVSGTF